MLEERRAAAGINSDVRAYAEQMLIDRIFMGDFQEKRLVSKLNTYKDLIVLNKHEKILCDDLANVRNRMLSAYPNAWFGYTEPTDIGAPAVYCIWTTLEHSENAQVPNVSAPTTASVGFGEYWFQIKAIRFSMNAMEIHVIALRPIDPTSSMSAGPTISQLTQQALQVDTKQIQQYVQQNIIEVDWIQLFNQWKASINHHAYRFISTEITWTNFIQCIRLLGVLSIALIKWSVDFVRSLGEFTLRLLSELNKLMKTASPIILAVINMFSKMIGGLYILLAMIWRDMFNGDSRYRPVRKPSYGFNGRAPIAYREYSSNQRQPRNSSRYQYNM